MNGSTGNYSSTTSGQAASQGICPCDTFVYPQIISNPAGRSIINYRFGDYLSIRYALLMARAGEVELVNWRPTTEVNPELQQGDLAVQMIEWWAYLGDILSFYNERIANQSYLLTASLPESVQGLIRILGYRPRPGIGATGTLAAAITGTKSFTLPAGFQIQSKPGPGQQPQIFELMAPTLVQPPDIIPAAPAPSTSLIGSAGSNGSSVLLQGVVTSAKAGDQLLLLDTGWPTQGSWSVATVTSLLPEKNPQGQTNTRVTFQTTTNLPAAPSGPGYRLMRSRQSAHVWQYESNSVIQSNQVDLESINRSIKVGDPVLFSLPDLASANQWQLVHVSQYTEAIWYANAAPGSDPSHLPPIGSPPEAAIPIPHTRLIFQTLTNITDSPTERSQALVLFNWQDVGTLIATPSPTLNTAPTTVSLMLGTPLPSSMLTMVNQDVLISDANGNGVEASATAVTASPSNITLAKFSDPTLTLKAPLNLLFNLLPVTRGKSVTNEILGNGDATVSTGQEFILQKSPLTYLLNPSSASGAEYTSTLQVWVNGVQWTEVPSFYGQPANARIFITTEDQQNMTHVQFGDGVNGARLPSGTNNVVANYRYGSGADAPAAGSLTVILQSWPGLKSILNPVPLGGGADPDPPQQIKTYAPQSVLAFGRAISSDDYETIAAQAPGVARARAYWSWNPLQQRMMTQIYVGDDANAVKAANTALANACDPNRPLQVTQAQSFTIGITLTLLINPIYATTDVVAAATAALIDPDTGLLGTAVIRIGQVIFQSQIYQACLSVPGAVAVHDLLITGITATGPDFQLNPGEGGFLLLPSQNLYINPEVSPNAS